MFITSYSKVSNTFSVIGFSSYFTKNLINYKSYKFGWFFKRDVINSESMLNYPRSY